MKLREHWINHCNSENLTGSCNLQSTSIQPLQSKQSHMELEEHRVDCGIVIVIQKI